MNVNELQFYPLVNTYPSIQQTFSSIENWKKPEASQSSYRSCRVVVDRSEVVFTEPSLLLTGQFWQALREVTSYMMFYYVMHPWWVDLQFTPDNSNLQGKSKKVRVIGSSKKITRSKEKHSFCTVSILITEMLSESWKKLLDYKSERKVTKCCRLLFEK